MPTPSGLPTKTDFQNATLDVAHLGRVVNSKDASGAPITTSTNRTGGVNKTLDALETEYTEAIRNAGGQPLGDGTWQAGQTFTAYNQFMVYNGIAYKPLTTTTLPYGPTGATPDLAFVGSFSDVTDADITIAQGELIGGVVFPSSGDLAVGMTVPIGTTHLRVDGAIYAMSPIATGSVTVVTSTGATIGGVGVVFVAAFRQVIHDVSGFNESTFGDKVKLISYHKPQTNAEAPYRLSGGDFIYYDLPRSLHNGGTIISPTVPCVTPFNNSTLIDFLKGVGETNPAGRGVWLRIDFAVNLSNFGADPYGALYSDKVFQHAVDSMYTTSDGITGTGVTIELTHGIYKIEYPLVFDKDYIKLIASGENETVLWKPDGAVRTDLGTNIAPLRDDVGGVVDSYDVDALVIYTHPDNGFRFGSEIRGVRMSGKSEDPAQSLTSYRHYGIYAPRAAQCTHVGISATRVAKLYYTFDTFKHTAEDLVSNFGGGIFYYVPDSSGKEASGTSLSANNCWASRPLTEAGLFLAAYEIVGLEYSTLTACSADNMFEPWRLKNSHLDVSSGSTEIARSASAFVVDGGNVTFTNLRTVAPAHTGAIRPQLECKGGAKVRLIGGKMSSRTNPDVNDIGVLVTDGASLISEYFEFPTGGTPYKIDMTSGSPARSAVITDENGISRIFDTQNPDGYFNAPKIAVSENTLLNKSTLINNRHKYRGREVMLTQNNKTLTAAGPNNTDPWVDSNGTVVITPV